MTDDAQSLMDRMYRPQRHIYDLTRKHYLLGRDQLIDRLNPPGGGAVLEIGCGTGRNLIRAARLYPKARFYGVDISAVMLDEAKASISRNKVAAPIVLAQGDAANFDPERLVRPAAVRAHIYFLRAVDDPGLARDHRPRA